MIRIARVDIDRKDVGIVDDAVLDVSPGLTAVGRFIRQIPGARVDGVDSSRIDGQRLDVDQAGRVVGRQLGPGVARIVRTEDAVESAGDKYVWIRFGLS